MLHQHDKAIRVLIADDESAVLDAYRMIFNGAGGASNGGNNSMSDLRAKLFGKGESKPKNKSLDFHVEYTHGAEEALDAVRKAHQNQKPFNMVFLDMRMPPGPDGVWAAREIRALDSNLDIVMATAYSDVDPREISEQVPPLDKIFYVQKPFHPYEVRQLALALGGKSEAEARIKKLAFYDGLTELPNREFFKMRLFQAIELAKRQKRPIAVLFMDLDNFKRINDTLGHSVGDQLLKTAAERLAMSVRSCDAITRLPLRGPQNDLARFGGDEFMILLTEINRSEDAAIVADRIRNNLSRPVQLGEHEVIVSTSIGIAVYPDDGEDGETLLRNADMAMYFAKRNGRNSFQYYSKSMNEAALKRLTLENMLRRALENDEFILWYQPQTNLFTGEVSGMEALLRWESPELGMVPPMEFISVAEECGLIIPIGEWVLRAACKQAKAWRDEGHSQMRIAVNISVLQFVNLNFPSLVKAILEETGLEPDALELEITESLLMKDGGNAIDTLNALKNLGVSLAIDDFGTGYSSLSRLKEFPIDRLKIDKSFIQAITSTKNEKAIASAVIAMADSMNLRVTAEGVETACQLSYLKENHCEEIQGFYISRPLPAPEAERFLKHQKSLQDAGEKMAS
jgi:diguanylate cyclase